MSRTHLLVFLTLGLLAAGGARADALESLRKSLAGSEPAQALLADVHVRNRTTRGKEDPRTTDAKLSLRLDVDADGLHIDYPRALLDRAQAERNAASVDPDHPTPTVTLLNALAPTDLQTMSNFAPALLRTLAGATLLSDQPGNWGGQAVRVLQLKAPARLGKEDRDAVDKVSHALTLWLTADGTPAAMTETFDAKGSKFFIRFSTHTTVKYTLQKVGTRLVVVRQQRDSSFSGFGQANEEHRKLTLQPVTAGS